MRTSKRRILSMVLALMLCFSVFSVTAFAGGGPEDGSDKVPEYWSQDSTPPQDTQQTPPAETTAPAAGGPLSVGSEFFTRDLLYNKDAHKQFIAVEGWDGNIFYIVIDYDAPVNEDEEQYQTYFLNKVDEADLSALVEQGEPAACICTDKCHAGAVYYLKFKKKKPDTKGSADLEDYDYGDEDEYEGGGAEDERDE